MENDDGLTDAALSVDLRRRLLMRLLTEDHEQCCREKALDEI